MEMKEREKIAEKAFIKLLGKEKIEQIKENNWVKFKCSFIEISSGVYDYVDYQFDMNFLNKDSKGDTVIYCGIHYNSQDKKWWSSNGIDYPYIKFDTFEEMAQHLEDIEVLIRKKH
jgi:hypothetical protein